MIRSAAGHCCLPTFSGTISFFLALTVAPLEAAEETVNYTRDVRPLLAEYCFACHGPDANSRDADFRLDQRDAAIEYGALVPGKADESALIERIFADDPDMIMPPPKTKKSLSESEKELLKKWVNEGAEYESHWAFQRPKQSDLPAVTDASWVKTPIDTFVLNGLEQVGLSPNPEADSRTLFRRLHLDITGLPPVPSDVEAFAADYAAQGDEALSTWIDKLMATSAWGEHRARYWLDAARYGDTHGLHFDNYREMWLYRDWVIRAFNKNQPFDQFVIEQLAGDLLSDPTTDQLIATGFQRCNITTNEGGTIDEENLALYASDRVQTFGWVFLGLTTNCAQCHDHKFDPFTMQDYYSLAAFFRNTTQRPKDGNAADGRGPTIMVPSEQDLPRWNALPKEIADAKAARDAHRKAARPAFQEWLNSFQPEDLRESIPSAGLALHRPRVAEEPREGEEPVELAVDGPLGPAPVIRSDRIETIPEAGDFDAGEPFSFGAWVKSSKDAKSAAVFARMDVKNGHRGWDLWVEGNTFATHLIDSWPDNAIKLGTKQNTIKHDKWQHVFVTYDGSRKLSGVKLYVDGKQEELRTLKDTLKPDSSFRTDTPLKVGQRSEGSLYDGASVQDVRIYDRTVSAAEVESIHISTLLMKYVQTEEGKRTKEQTNQFFEYYLTHDDAEYPPLAKVVTDREAEYNAIKGRSPVTHVQEEKPDSQAMAYVLMRGEYDKKGDEVMADTPAMLHAMAEGARRDRMGLAEWVVDANNPLTSRVTVNRFWQEVFGQGLVATAEDFGVMGMPPTNPDLLDWLAVEFESKGWDVRKLFKTIFMSATYRQTAQVTPEKLEKDRDNSLFSRGPRFRMDAEMVRDYALASSGLLSRKMFGPGTKPYQPEGIWDVVGLPSGNTRNYIQDKGENLYRRSVYSFWKRMAPPPNLEALNAPSREVCVVRRERTNTPLQALVTLNDPQFFEAARRLAEQTLTGAQTDRVSRIQSMALQLVSREFSDIELQIAQTSLGEYLDYYGSNAEAASQVISFGDSTPDANLDPIKLAAWTMLANQLMNLDEVLNK